MPADAFMRFVGVLIVCLILATYLVRKILVRYPGTAFAGFTSPREIGRYFGFARAFLRHHRWLTVLAVILPITNYAIQFRGWQLMRSSLVQSGHTFTIPINTARIRFLLTQVPLSLQAGFKQFGLSAIVMCAIVLAVLLESRSVRKLRSIGDGEPGGGLAFVERWIFICRSLLLVTGIPLVVSVILRVTVFSVPFGAAFFAAALLTDLLGSSLIEGAIFSYVRGRIHNEAVDRRTAIRWSLTVVRPLFYWNLFVSAFVGWSYWVTFHRSLSLVAGREVASLPAWFLTAMYHWRLLSGVAVAFLILGPFSLTIAQSGFWGLLRANFDFVGKHFLKYLSFVALGTAVLFLPGFFQAILGSSIPAYSILDLVVEILISALSLYLALVFALMAFRFYYDHAKSPVVEVAELTRPPGDLFQPPDLS